MVKDSGLGNELETKFLMERFYFMWNRSTSFFKTSVKMKNIQRFKFILFFLVVLSIKLHAQKKYALQIDILPFCVVEQTGTGVHIALQRQLKRKLYAELAYGLTYDFIDQSGYDSPKANGLPIGKYTTEVSVKDVNNTYNFTLPDKSLIDDFNRLGFKQITPFKSYRLDNYCSLNVGMSLNKFKNWVIRPQFGAIVGMANRAQYGGALTSNLSDNPFAGSDPQQGWIVFQIYSRYWYIGATSKITIERRIKEGVYLGVPIGINFIFDKKFRTDDLIFYTGLSLKVGF